MRKRAVANSVAAGMLVIGVLIGVSGYYVATTYQTKTTTVTQTITQQLTTTSTQTSLIITTSVVSKTTTQTSFVTSTTTSSVYPVPMNVTVYVVPGGAFVNYAIQAGSYSASGSLGSPQSFSVAPVFQNETITVSINMGCGGSTGPTGSAILYVNGVAISRTSIACGGNTTGQISYVL